MQKGGPGGGSHAHTQTPIRKWRSDREVDGSACRDANPHEGTIMKTATALALVAVGAILAFAVTANTSVFNLHIAGWVIMATGIVGVLMRRAGYGAVRRRLIFPRGVRRGTVNIIDGTTYPPYVKRNPGTSARDAGLASVPNIGPGSVVDETVPIDDVVPAGAEVVEEVYEE